MKNIFFFSFLIGTFATALGQCTNQIIHLEGTELINGIQVTATPFGMYTINEEFCSETTPYIIGFNEINGGGEGGYTFTFSPAVSLVTINFGGISNALGSSEEVRVKVNGNPYPVPAVGDPNSCGPMAVLTSEGNVAGCENCNVSGWNGTTIEGPISSLTLTNITLEGFPAGSIFSLFICDAALGILDNQTNINYNISPNPFSETATISLKTPITNGEISLYSASGQLVKNVENVSGSTFSLEGNGLSNGIYFVKISEENKKSILKKVVIINR